MSRWGEIPLWWRPESNQVPSWMTYGFRYCVQHGADEITRGEMRGRDERIIKWSQWKGRVEWWRGCVFMSGLGESVTFSFTHKQTTPSKMVEGQKVKEGRRRGIQYDGGEMHRHLWKRNVSAVERLGQGGSNVSQRTRKIKGSLRILGYHDQQNVLHLPKCDAV